MHPVKAEEAIAEAYFTHGVRTFSLDTMEELEKIVARHQTARPTSTCCVRIRVSSDHAKLSLASKFGAEPREMKALLIAARQAADALGICFHVGSQAMTPGRLCRGDGAGARGDRRGGGHRRHRRCRRRLSLLLSRHGAAAARGLFRGHPRRVREPADLLFGGAVVRAGPGAVRRICERAGPRREAPRRHSSTSTTAPMARCSTPPISAGASR